MSNVALQAVPGAPPADRRFDFRILYTGVLIAVLCGMFWVGSRYPSLQGKASADPNEALSTPLGFERHWPEPSRDQVLKHIGWTSAEWAITNREGMTFGLLLASITAKYRDFQHLTGFVVQLWMYVSPVIFPFSRIQEKFPHLSWLGALNPMTAAVENVRVLFFGVPPMAVPYECLSVGVAVTLCVFGVLMYQRTARTFIDTV